MDEIDSSRDGSDGPMCRTYEVGLGEPYCVAIVCAIADVAGYEPLALPELLCDAVDVDALEAMFSPPPTERSARMRLSFLYCGYSVTVAPDRVVIENRDAFE